MTVRSQQAECRPFDELIDGPLTVKRDMGDIPSVPPVFKGGGSRMEFCHDGEDRLFVKQVVEFLQRDKWKSDMFKDFG